MRTPDWIFGYGSLMWDPGFEWVEDAPARLHGWHRRFSLLSTSSWGSAERPGLCLAVHPGGSTLGRALRMHPDRMAETLAYLDEREAGYRRRRVRLRTARGVIEALTYVHDPANPRHADHLPHAERLQLIRQGAGRKGSSRFYLRSTVEWLDAQGVRRGAMHRLLADVEREA